MADYFNLLNTTGGTSRLNPPQRPGASPLTPMAPAQAPAPMSAAPMSLMPQGAQAGQQPGMPGLDTLFKFLSAFQANGGPGAASPFSFLSPGAPSGPAPSSPLAALMRSRSASGSGGLY